MELGSGFEELWSENGGINKKDGERVKIDLVLKKNEEITGGSELKRVMSSVDEKSVVEYHTGREPMRFGTHNGPTANALLSLDNSSTESVKENDVVSESSAIEEHESNKKRKRENNSNFLKWMSVVARDPCDQTIGSLPERSKWKFYSSEHLWKHALLVRESLFVKPAHSHWKNKPMHPGMFEDSILGFSQRMATSQRMVSIKSRKKLQCILNAKKMSTARAYSAKLFWLDNNYKEGRNRVGPEFQADVRKWNRKTEESDPKWLGFRIWPIRTKGRNTHERVQIGKGRQETCGCQIPGSLQCVGFHNSMDKERIKLELGPAYYEWKFDQVGEEVARFWTREEECIFHDAMRSIPFSTGMHVFNKLLNNIIGKDMASLVRYYFNVFILRRRAYQNRFCQNDIDSGDEI